jgi:type II secretory pathway component PulF
LAAALESLSATARRTAELRRLVGAGILYPLIVLGMAYLLFVFLVLRVMPGMFEAHVDLTGGADAVTAALDWLGCQAAWWVIPVPLAAVILLGAWWRRSAGALWSSRSGISSETRCLKRPNVWLGAGIRQTLRNGRMAAFAEVLSLLVKERVPLGDSVTLAAEASGDRAIAVASRVIADRFERGEILQRREDLPGGFPPMLGWLLLSGGRQAELSEALSRSAAVYRQRAARAATWTAVYLPISLTVLVGGTATLLCALAAFVPIARLLYDLSGP